MTTCAPSATMASVALRISTLTTALALGLYGNASFAAGTASDTSANYAAGNSWSTTAPNLGSGFGAWSFSDNNNSSSGPYAGVYLDLSSYGNSDGVLTGGSAWGSYANGGSGNGFISITRSFTGGPSGSSSLYNQTFSVDLGGAGVGSGGLLEVSLGNAFSFGYGVQPSDNFYLSVGGGAATATPVNFSELNAGIQISVAVTGPLNSTSEGYTLTVSPVAGGSSIFSTSGTFDSSVYNTSSFGLLDQNTSSDGFFNNLNISAEAVPEPSSVALLGLSGVAAIAWFRRRK